MLGVDQPPDDPAYRSIATRDDDRRVGCHQLVNVHLGVEFDYQAVREGLAELGFDLWSHRARLGAQDQKAGRALAALRRSLHLFRASAGSDSLRTERASAVQPRPSASPASTSLGQCSPM